MTTPAPSVSLRAALGGLLAALLALTLLGAAVGVERVVGGLAAADPSTAAAVLVAAATWFVAWGLSLYVALRTLRVGVTPRRAVLVYASATFLNGLTPFAQVGGEALAAAVISRSTDATYERGLAAVMAVDVVNLVPSPLFALVGVAWLVAAGASSAAFRPVALAFLGVSVTVFAAVAVAWRLRAGAARWLTRAGVGAVAAANRFAGRAVTVDADRLAGRVGSFLAGTEAVFGNRSRLGVCLGLSTVGWGCLVLALWLSLRAVGHPVPAGVAAFVLPVSMLAIVVPLPGGVGGVEAALVGLLVAVGGVPAPAATAGVLLYRGATYWTPLLFGGVVTAALTAASRAPARRR